MKKMFIKRVILILFLILLFNFIFPKNSSVAKELSEMIGEADSFISEGKDGISGLDTSEIAKEFVPLGQLLTIIGMGVMIAATTFMGIKYLTASPEGQAKLKEQLIGLVVAGIIIFGAYNIWKIVLDIVSQFESTT